MDQLKILPKRMKTRLGGGVNEFVMRGSLGHSRVGSQRCGHCPRDDFLILPQVGEGCERETPVCDLARTIVSVILIPSGSDAARSPVPRSECLRVTFSH